MGELCHRTLKTLLDEQYLRLKMRRQAEREKVARRTSEISFCNIIIDKAFPVLKELRRMAAFDKSQVD